MEIQPYVCFLKLFLDKGRYKQEMIIMNKNLLGHLPEFIFDFNNFLCKFLIQGNITGPVHNAFILHIIKVLKVMKQRPYVILIKQQKRQRFFSCHENWISAFFLELGI